MDAKTESDKSPDPVSAESTPTNAEAEKLLEHNRKVNTSGLNWDEVTDSDSKNQWRQITEMGEGD